MQLLGALMRNQTKGQVIYCPAIGFRGVLRGGPLVMSYTAVAKRVGDVVTPLPRGPSWPRIQ